MTTELVISIVLAIFASTGFWAFLQKILENQGKMKPVDKMILALGRDKLLILNKKYRRMGWIPSDEYEMYSGVYDAYISMGGNSMVRKGFEDNKALPIKDEEEDDELCN